MLSVLLPYLKPGMQAVQRESYVEFAIENISPAIEANAFYFNHPEWATEYLTYCHRSESFKSRWEAALGDWTGKIVVDIGCGPGNIFATLKGKPKLIIGVDVAGKSLELAKDLGYLPVLADANKLPFTSSFADIVVLNATLHHCQSMSAVLREAARLVKPGGLLVSDHDPQKSAWDYKGLAKLLWKGRLIIYKIMGHGFHKTSNQQQWALRSEIHHQPGHGLDNELFKETLEPLGFTVKIYPHNHQLGFEVLKGDKGRAAFKYRLGNLLSGRNPNSLKSALSLMCVANKY